MKTLALIALAGAASGALADVSSESAGQFAGAMSIDYRTGAPTPGTPRFQGTAYSNVLGTTIRAFSSTDLSADYGDRLTTVGTGTLDAFTFGLFNSGTSAGPLGSATVDIAFFRGVDGSPLGGFGVNTGAINLAQGFFTLLTISGLSGLGIDLDTTDIIFTQSIRTGTITGGATRTGVVSLEPIQIGSAIPQLYINATTVGAAGFYNITSAGVPVNFFLGAQIDVVPAPASAALLGLGGLVATRRRR
ncbi:MAG: PEP-CTERM sorting domain-containing protein [Phycisphaerales bacterium]|jgi:hypothetical protein|nr:PEP-CTERM sorting domain-containing protein [Phycisphaerales bacterium]